MATLAGLNFFPRNISSCLRSTARSFLCSCSSRKSYGVTLMPAMIDNAIETSSNHNLPSEIQHRCYATKSSKKKPMPKKDGEKPDLKSGPGVAYHETPIMFVNASYNNTMFSITDHKGKVAAWTSAGVEGFKGAKRGTNYAGQMAAVAAAKKAKSLGIDTMRVKIRGMGPGRQSSIKGLMTGGVEIISVTDVTPVPHNGCKPPKQRRI